MSTTRTRKRRNPFTRTRRRTARRNPVFAFRRRKARRHTTRRHNPILRRRHTRRHTRRNPINLRALTSRQGLMTAATVGIGIAVGYALLPIISSMLPASLVTARKANTGAGRFLGLINVAVGLLVASAMRQARVKQIGMVVAGMGVYDLIASNVPTLGLAALPINLNVAGTPIGPKLAGSYPALVSPASGMAGSYGRSSYGSNYSPIATRGFGDDNPLVDE